jgi:hypothetical protein
MLMFRPFRIVPRIKYPFLIFLSLVFAIGHLGIIAAYLVQREKVNLDDYLLDCLKNGVLYNMGISFLATAIHPVIVEFLETRENRFRGLKLSVSVISFVVLVFYVLLFATSLGKTDALSVFLQVLSYLTSLFLTIYLFLTYYLDQDYDTFADMDDERRDALAVAGSRSETDSRGVRV